MTWWWLWDAFILASLMLTGLAHLTKKDALMSAWCVCLCWMAFLRVLSSYGAW